MVVLPSSIGPVMFGYPSGLYALGGLILLFILYLIRPRPKKMELPSLMFFMRSSGKSIVQSFFRTIMRDLLFLLQLLIALTLLLMPAQPYTNTTINLAAQHTVFVIDNSASSQVLQDGVTRLQSSITQAKNLVGKTNTIVLAKGTPQVVADDLAPLDAKKALDGIKPTDTSSRIGEAMLIAGEELEEDGRIVVFSDFDNTDGIDPTTARTALESRGKHVTLINTAQGDVNNVGFVDLAAGEDLTTAYIRNYGSKDVTLPLHIGDDVKQVTIPAGNVLPVQFKTPPSITTLKLDTGDAFPADDSCVVSAPEEAQVRVLLITNDKSHYLESALTSSPRVALTVSEPPIISKDPFDVYIVDSVNAGNVLPGTYTDLLQYARNGAGVVIDAQAGMGGVNYEDLLPINIVGDGKDAYVRVDQDMAATHNVDFGNVKTYVKATPREGAVSLASTADNSTIIALKPEGTGLVAYYGLFESSSEFKLTPDYPIFWQNLVRVMAQRADLSDLNLKVGDSITVDDDTLVETPDGQQLSGPIVTFEHAGVYKVGDRTVAVNCLNARESALISHPEIAGQADANGLGAIKEERQFDWGMALLIAATVLLLAEIIFLKVRGDI